MKLLDDFVAHKGPDGRAERTTVAEWGGYTIDIVVHIGDMAVCMTPADDPSWYEHSWCYPSIDSVLRAVREWDPETQAEPSYYTHCQTSAQRGYPRVAGTKRRKPQDD